MLWCQTPSRKKRVVVFTAVTTSAHQDQLKTKRFSKVCEIFKVCGTESLNTPESFTHRSVIVADISTPRNVTLNETNCDWLFDMSVKWPHGWALANESCHVFQTFSHQSEGLAKRDYQAGNILLASAKPILVQTEKRFVTPQNMFPLLQSPVAACFKSLHLTLVIVLEALETHSISQRKAFVLILMPVQVCNSSAMESAVRRWLLHTMLLSTMWPHSLWLHMVWLLLFLNASTLQ